MRAHGPLVDETIDAAPKDHPIEIGRGQCVRIFAVAEASVPDLDLTLLAPNGETLAVDGIDDRWPILLPDRPICVADAGTYVIRVRARQGTGRYAMQAWLLP